MRTADDALTDNEFERLLGAVEDMKSPQCLQARFIILVSGRLGMRAGEISHIKKTWVSFKKKMINIPYYEPCNCGYCKQQAIQEVEHNSDLTLEEAMGSRWHAKTEHASRAVPYSFSERVKECVEEFFEEYEEFPISRNGVNRRVRKVAVLSGINKHIYPHALRATCATHHAYNGLPQIALQDLMGWTNLKTAQKYIRKSGGATKKALDKLYDKKER